ncbi:MAG TPA: polysaccharide biosynthesis/export family protein [Candidatus Binataceae bacterium]|nr:polysaccharide biosynthesis/export family protein [Candidatus Binataceae bacterium]
MAFSAALVASACFGPAVRTRTIPNANRESASPDVIGRDDEVEVIVWTQPQLSGKVVVAPDGTITMPLIGRVKAAGMTPDQLKEDLQTRYSRYLHETNVTVRITDPASHVFYVTGEVNKAGIYKLHSGEVLSQAIAEAGGFGEFADSSKIRIMRRGATETQELTVDFNRAVSGGDVSADVPIEPGDTITVP